MHIRQHTDRHVPAAGGLRRVTDQLDSWRSARVMSPRVRHRFSDAVAVMAFSALVSGFGALVLTALTWWSTRAGA